MSKTKCHFVRRFRPFSTFFDVSRSSRRFSSDVNDEKKFLSLRLKVNVSIVEEELGRIKMISLKRQIEANYSIMGDRKKIVSH